MISLDEVVNLTDFIELGTLLRMFEVDQLESCVELLRVGSAVGMDHLKDEGLTRL